MKLTRTSTGIIVLILSIVLVSTAYVGYIQFFIPSENASKIISMDLMKSNAGNNFTVSLKIKNTGENDVNNADLHIIFIKDNDIIVSAVQTFSLETNLESTYKANFIDMNFKTDSFYKVIASIYLENESLDSKTITKQF